MRYDPLQRLCFSTTRLTAMAVRGVDSFSISQSLSSIQQEEDSFHQQIRLKLKEETGEGLHLEHSIALCRNAHTLENNQNYSESFEM